MGISADIAHCRYRFSTKFQLSSNTDTEFGLEPNEFCNQFGYNCILRAARLQNEIAPRKKCFFYTNGTETAKKDLDNDLKRLRKMFSPSLAA